MAISYVLHNTDFVYHQSLLIRITYNLFLPNIPKTIGKNWIILEKNENFKEIFKNEPITAFKRDKKIQEIIETHSMENGRAKKYLKTLKEGKCTPRR